LDIRPSTFTSTNVSTFNYVYVRNFSEFETGRTLFLERPPIPPTYRLTNGRLDLEMADDLPVLSDIGPNPEPKVGQELTRNKTWFKSGKSLKLISLLILFCLPFIWDEFIVIVPLLSTFTFLVFDSPRASLQNLEKNRKVQKT